MKRELGRGEHGRRTASPLRRVVATIALTFAALIAVVAQAQAATFTVGSTADTGGCASPPSGTTCTLRQLVNSVPAGSTISVPAGTYTLTAGELLIDQNLTITGAGARTTTVEQNPPAGTPTARVFDIQKDPTSGAAPTVTISGLEILFGKTTSASPNANAGGNILNEGTLTLSEDDIVLGETTGGAGAGVANINATLTITHSLLEDNLSFASSGTGGISGGIDNVASGATTSTVTVNNSTLVSNTAQGGAGAIGNRCIRCTSSTVTVVDSTIYNNDGGTATANAGGLIAGSGTSISVRNSIIASNTISSGATASNCAGSITSNGHNIETSTDCGFKTATDLQNTDPDFLVAGVADMGGNTDVLPLAAASPAVDAIPTGTTGCSSTDQRDISRPQGASCDIGAYELVEPVEGQSFSEVVGRIDNTSATIDWGDGTAQSQGSVNTNEDNQVTGTHTYAEAGTYHGQLHWINSDGSPSTSPVRCDRHRRGPDSDRDARQRDPRDVVQRHRRDVHRRQPAVQGVGLHGHDRLGRRDRRVGWDRGDERRRWVQGHRHPHVPQDRLVHDDDHDQRRRRLDGECERHGDGESAAAGRHERQPVRGPDSGRHQRHDHRHEPRQRDRGQVRDQRGHDHDQHRDPDRRRPTQRARRGPSTSP